MNEVLVNRLGGLSLPRKSVVKLTDRPDMTLDVYRGRKRTIQQHQFKGHTHLTHICPVFQMDESNFSVKGCLVYFIVLLYLLEKYIFVLQK